jgi:hypothetical protein
LRLIALALTLALLSAPAAAQDAAPVVAAERAFAADGLALGVDRSFLKWSTPDAVLIGPDGPGRAHDNLDPSAVVDPAAPALVWWPNWAGIARSGELGFTTGAVEVGGRRQGHYFTVWERQPDGNWLWVYDGGAGASSTDAPGPDSEPAILSVATVGSASPEAAMAEVREAERALGALAATDQKAAHLAALAENARLYVAPLPPATNPAAFAEALATWPRTFLFGLPEGGGASQGGDLVWTYGPAVWTRDDQPRGGTYVHLWQKRAEGWRLVLAQLVPKRPPQPPQVTPPPAAG